MPRFARFALLAPTRALLGYTLRDCHNQEAGAMASKFFANFIDEMQARVEIEDTIKRFIRGIDRQDWDLALSTYHEGAIDEHGFFNGPAPEFIRVCAQAHAKQQHSMHLMTNSLIEFSARNKAMVETYCLVFQRFGAEEKGVAPGSRGLRKMATARYLDTFEQRAGAWRVAHRKMIFGDIQAEQISDTVGFPPGFTEQRHGMEDFLYTDFLYTSGAARSGN